MTQRWSEAPLVNQKKQLRDNQSVSHDLAAISQCRRRRTTEAQQLKQQQSKSMLQVVSRSVTEAAVGETTNADRAAYRRVVGLTVSQPQAPVLHSARPRLSSHAPARTASTHLD